MKDLIIENTLNKYEHTLFDIEHVYINNNTDTLIVLFAGAINKYIMLSWFYNDKRNSYLFLKDDTFNCYINESFNSILSFYSQSYINIIYVGLSMGGVAALLHAQNHFTTGVLVIDCFPVGKIDIEMLYEKLNDDFKFNPVIYQISSSDSIDKDRQLIIHNKLIEKNMQVIFERSDQKIHLGYIPSKLTILNFIEYCIKRKKIVSSNKDTSYCHKVNDNDKTDLWE